MTERISKERMEGLAETFDPTWEESLLLYEELCQLKKDWIKLNIDIEAIIQSQVTWRMSEVAAVGGNVEAADTIHRLEKEVKELRRKMSINEGVWPEGLPAGEPVNLLTAAADVEKKYFNSVGDSDDD